MTFTRWSASRINAWYAAQPWLVGCNFTPSTAVNQLEFWQAETFDPLTIGRELGWAAELGFNTVRAFLHDLAWQQDAEGFKARLDRFLEICQQLSIRPMLVFFDDCWNPDPHPGRQPDPVPGVHNSGWVMSPGKTLVTDQAGWGRLEDYVKDVLSAFATDKRILAWDLYNEPGNNGLNEQSLPLLQAAFAWARQVHPSQPLTAAVWYDNPPINQFLLEDSDLITFHNYNEAADLERQIMALKVYGRPLICSEYMLRGRGSRFKTHLPIFKREKVGCYNWGLVSGKTQTIFQWGQPLETPEPPLWFHDIFRRDGSSYDPAETAFIRKILKHQV